MEMIIFYEVYALFLLILFTCNAKKKIRPWKGWCILCGVLTAISPFFFGHLFSFIPVGQAGILPQNELFMLSYVPWPWVIGMGLLNWSTISIFPLNNH